MMGYTKSRVSTKKNGPGDPPASVFKAGTAPNLKPKVDVKAKTSERFKSEPNYNWQDAKSRGSKDVPREMVAKRKEFDNQYREGKFETKKQYKDSLITTYSPSATRREIKGKQLDVTGRVVNVPKIKRDVKKVVKNTKIKARKMVKQNVGTPGPGVNLCTSKSAF